MLEKLVESTRDLAPRRIEQQSSEQQRIEQRNAEALAAAAEFARSPVGRASAARARGDGFFQTQLCISNLVGEPSSWGSSENRIEVAGSARTDGRPDILTQIENVGWHLEHVGYVFVETGATSTNRPFVTGQATVSEGMVLGIYLFRAKPDMPAKPPMGAAAELATEARD